MAGLFATIEAFKEVTELATLLSSPRRNEMGRNELLAKQAFVRALRDVYFPPKGVVSIIKEIAEGGYPSSEDISAALPEFNDYETQLSRSIDTLADDRLAQKGKLTLRAQRELSEIASEKTEVRRRVQILLNISLTLREDVSQSEARKLLAQIECLNAAVEDAEDALAELLR